MIELMKIYLFVLPYFATSLKPIVDNVRVLEGMSRLNGGIVWLSWRYSIKSWCSNIRTIYMDPRMMTSSNGNIFRVTGHLCGEFTGPR